MESCVFLDDADVAYHTQTDSQTGEAAVTSRKVDQSLGRLPSDQLVQETPGPRVAQVTGQSRTSSAEGWSVMEREKEGGGHRQGQGDRESKSESKRVRKRETSNAEGWSVMRHRLVMP